MEKINCSLKKCSICEKEKPFPEDFYLTNKGKSSYSWCKKCHIRRGTEFRRSPIGMFTQMKKDAKKNGIEFTLTIQGIEVFWQKPCSFCNEPIGLVSLDRVDNEIGYISENVVPCCRWCNYTKATGSVSFFYEQCKRVVEHMPKEFLGIGDPEDGGVRFPAQKARRNK